MQHHYGLFLRNMPAQSNQQLALLIPTFQKKNRDEPRRNPLAQCCEFSRRLSRVSSHTMNPYSRFQAWNDP